MKSIEAHKNARTLIKKRDGKKSGTPTQQKVPFSHEEYIVLAKASLITATVQVSGNYIVQPYDGFIEVTEIGALITLPVADNPGESYEIKNNTNGVIYVNSISNIGGSPDQWTILAGATFCLIDNGTEYIVK